MTTTKNETLGRIAHVLTNLYAMRNVVKDNKDDVDARYVYKELLSAIEKIEATYVGLASQDAIWTARNDAEKALSNLPGYRAF